MNKYLFLLTFSIFTLCNKSLVAQTNLYNIDLIPKIRIYFEQTNWDHILDSLYVDGNQDRLLATVSIDGTVLDSVGIRYKGFSSVSTNRDKNPFNIKLDYVKGNQRYDGINKIKLGNVIQDPSFLREVLSYEIARKYMPASLANYANVYINDVFWGLYSNIESVAEDFILQNFGSNNNAFFKCNPATLDFDGENSNLGNSPGTDPSDYYPYYTLESSTGWGDLYELIDVLNENPTNIETVLNVDRTLWMHAFNYALINFDSYVGYAQNYYLYKKDDGQFNPIIWDLNQSFASYRLTDASEHFDGFSIAEAKTMDPLLHYSSVSVVPRPLLRNLFENDTYRRMYIAHLRTIIEENFANQDYEVRAQYLHDLIENSVLADTNKFYSNDDFYNNINSTVNDLVDYPGITDLMDARTNYLQTYPGYQGSPTISNIDYSPSVIAAGDDIWITAEVANASNVTLAYRFGGNGLFQKATMLDDGSQNDGAANDSVFGIQLNNIGNSIQYYFYAENTIAGRFAPERAGYEYFSLQTNIIVGDLVINEFLASNTSTASDEAGEFDDWIELYNNADFTISTGSLFLSDNPDNLLKWAMPDVAIAPDHYLIVWADEDQPQGALHANFKLSSGGETLSLSNASEMVMDSITFGEQMEDRSTGRFPNGTGPFVDMPATFGTENVLIISVSDLQNSLFTLFPNPVQNALTLKFETESPTLLQLYSVDGKLLKTQVLDPNDISINVSVNDLPNGLYLVSLVYEDTVLNRKIIIQR
ncbi:MAG: hypothetical protein ACI8X3_000473 [Saprospiraceae bacterium]|jgi:hypothetical protein